ncbi:hypothetical protein JVT61DRAFT_3980 [Boletus reticuloceps]|uniref:Uncharacterized protein n=1 Tax=Boletus reticuloceps TaxID=495285 RepID=A0A8I3A7F0_9AGAM|nr:hypothetical protein JVT61DRAFT_3980 [Boletus reticuloceps]
MFPPPRPSSPRQRSASCSTDDQSSTKDRPRKLFQRHYAHDLSFSSHSLATTISLHDDLPTPSMPTHASHTTSVHSTPMTSPSTGYSSLFPGSLSSATSESAPSADSRYRSEFGLLIPGSSAYSPILGSASSRSSHPVSPWSRSTTESDLQSSAPHIPQKRPSDIAVQSPSRFSLNSATTTPPDSEASSSSFHVPAASGKWSMTPRKSRPPDLEISGSIVPAIPSPGRDSNTPIDAHRRYASEVAAKMTNSRTGSCLATSQDSIDVSFRNVTPVRGKDPKTRNVLRRRPSGSAKLFKASERGMSSPSPRPVESHTNHLHLPPKEGMSRQAGVPYPLTPAGAVVEAYKQQELHRDDMPSPPILSIDDRMSSTASHDGAHDQDHLEHSPAPYYTVFGTSSERRVRAGGPDDWLGRFEANQRTLPLSQGMSLHQPSMSDPGGRGLTRKLSSRWRKVKGAGVAPEESPLRDRGHAKGRPSLQEIWGNDTSTLRSTGQSMDGVPNPADGAWASPIASHARSESKEDKNEGPKLWGLMRRISTGGLRDRFQSNKAVPPVPAIPKDLLKKLNPPEHTHDPLSRSHHQPFFFARQGPKSDVHGTQKRRSTKRCNFFLLA